MKNVKTLRFKPLVYLFLSAVVLSFSAFSCEGCDEDYAPLEIQIENKTGYDLTNIKIDDIQITSLAKNETSGYIQTKDFEPMKSVYATLKGKFERELHSFGTDSGLWCGTGLEDYPVKKSGKHNFVIVLYQYDDGHESLGFLEK
ncbi:hypothetical protein [Bernardetia sp.]|uniref:hypothetical protein n=1 Tax=Bernardetia sp. TaxID=1937974 RepID=UPI0025C64EC4|nr:hypothetical protein [Bernardetia sp.]